MRGRVNCDACEGLPIWLLALLRCFPAADINQDVPALLVFAT
jgi:hypothetical protein